MLTWKTINVSCGLFFKRLTWNEFLKDEDQGWRLFWFWASCSCSAGPEQTIHQGCAIKLRLPLVLGTEPRPYLRMDQLWCICTVSAFRHLNVCLHFPSALHWHRNPQVLLSVENTELQAASENALRGCSGEGGCYGDFLPGDSFFFSPPFDGWRLEAKKTQHQCEQWERGRYICVSHGKSSWKKEEKSWSDSSSEL